MTTRNFIDAEDPDTARKLKVRNITKLTLNEKDYFNDMLRAHFFPVLQEVERPRFSNENQFF